MHQGTPALNRVATTACVLSAGDCSKTGSRRGKGMGGAQMCPVKQRTWGTMRLICWQPWRHRDRSIAGTPNPCRRHGPAGRTWSHHPSCRSLQTPEWPLATWWWTSPTHLLSAERPSGSWVVTATPCTPCQTSVTGELASSRPPSASISPARCPTNWPAPPLRRWGQGRG